MPYSIYKKDNKFCVKNTETGESKGCSDTKEMAVKHMRALWAAEGGAKMGKKEMDMLVKEVVRRFDEEYPEDAETPQEEPQENKEVKEDGIAYSPYGVTSYDELDSMRDAEERAGEISELIYRFPSLASNIIASPDIEDKEAAIKQLADELAVRVKSAQTKELEKSIQPKPTVKSKIDAVLSSVKEAITGLFSDDNEKPDDNLVVWYDKEANRWMWLTRYSNNFRDRDNPSEIISADSHRRFVELVDKGLAPLPEYWLWHIPQWKVGQATWVAYDEAGFAMSAGYFDKGCEQVAEWLSKQSDFAASHGMPPHTIKRDPNDKSIIIEHETREISALPRKFAANLLTDVVAFTKEADMAIPEEKRKTLMSWGMPADVLEQIEQLNATTAEKAVEAGLERKEQEEVVAEEVTETPAETPAETKPEEEVQETQETPEVDPADQPPTRKEVAEAVISFIEPYLKEIVSLKEQVAQLNEALAEKKESDEERVIKTIQDTPMASLAALLTKRAIGAEETQVEKKEKLAKTHPTETKAADETPGGLPSFITSMFSAGKE